MLSIWKVSKESTFSWENPLNMNRPKMLFKKKKQQYFYMDGITQTLGPVQSWGFRDKAQGKQVTYL